MDCNKCKKNLGKCTCLDIDERMEDLRNNPNFIYKMCAACGLHYERCKCDEPLWVTSHDGVSLEEATGMPTLGDKLRENNQKAHGSAKEQLMRQFHQAMTEGIPDDAPEELKLAIELLKKLGIEIHVFTGDPNDLPGPLKESANKNDLLHFEDYQKSGGKLN